MKLARFLPITAVVLIIAGVFYWALFIPKEDVPQEIYKTIEEQSKKADLLFKKVTFEEVAAGVKYWQLEAAIGSVNKSTGIATLQNTKGTFFKKGKAALMFRSPGALWDMQRKEIYLDKPVGYDISLERKIKNIKGSALSIFNLPDHYKGEHGYWFQANNLRWKLADEQIICTGGIVLNKGEISGYAQKLQGDVGLEKIKLDGAPYIIVNTFGASPVTIEADEFEVLGQEDQLIARENPRLSWQDARITSKTARYFQKDKKLELTGEVKLNYRDIFARGETAEYFIRAQKVILSGNAYAEQGENKLSGDKVMVLLKNNKISVLGKSRVIIGAP